MRHRDYDRESILVQIPANNDTISGLYTQSILSKNLALWNNKVSDLGHQSYKLSKQRIGQISIDEDETYKTDTKNIEEYTGISQVSPTRYATVDFIPRRTRENFSYFYVGNAWVSRTEEEMENRRKFENVKEMKPVREKLAKYFMGKYKRYTQEELDNYLEFAQRMKNNTVVFETFCSNNAITN